MEICPGGMASVPTVTCVINRSILSIKFIPAETKFNVVKHELEPISFDLDTLATGEMYV